MRLVIFQPDIPQNTGTMLRLAACFGLSVDLIEPCGFVFDDRRLRRAGMDYLDGVDLTRHRSWESYLDWRPQHPGRLLLLTTKTAKRYSDIAFQPTDSLLVGQESAGVPQHVHDKADGRITIPMRPGFRSLNVAVAAALVIGEAQRQLGFPSAG
ncbi:MAG TPA: tRNA (cytidine(34)-2'-O)-methyltransferase [Dongiaceae bacterium]|nr:tRNA (cytidine(34)-2'-O)-methyltransferase [Dongiaceae bacterium]